MARMWLSCGLFGRSAKTNVKDDMSNQNYGPDNRPQGPQQPGQGGQPASQNPGAQPSSPNQGGEQPTSQYPTSQQPTSQYPGAQPWNGQQGQGASASQQSFPGSQPSGQGSQYPGSQPGNQNFQGGYGPQGAGQNYGGQTPPPGGPNPPTAGGKGGPGKWIAIGAVVLIVAIIAIFAFTRLGGNNDKPTGPSSDIGSASAPATSGDVPSAPASGGTQMDELEVGQCLQFVEVPGATPEADGSISVTHQVVDCNLAGEFKLIVASVDRGDVECATDYVNYYQTGYLGSDYATLSLCLAPVLDVGVCYVPDNIKEWIPVPCTDPEADFKVESEVPGTDASSCSYPDVAFILPDPEPAKVYCITDPTA